MRKIIFTILFMPFVAMANNDSLIAPTLDSVIVMDSEMTLFDDSNVIQVDTLDMSSIKDEHIDERTEQMQIEAEEIRMLKKENIVAWRLHQLNEKTSMDLAYNAKVQTFIDSYLGRNKRLISRMHGLAPYYFPLFQEQLEQYNLPLELRYLAIVESALNPKARSRSGATGLWQFMYRTGKIYGLKVNSYIDERKDPLKSTIAACEYFVKLYDIFGDWNLVLAAYNGGPGYLQGKIKRIGTSDFWELYPHLKTETRNFVPTFIAVNYAMNYASEHEIQTEPPSIHLEETDTITLKNQVQLKVLAELLCINSEIINYLNPSYIKDIYPKDAVLTLPLYAVNDFKLNESANYTFIDAVDKKEILINEERILYRVRKGDYLGRIAKRHNVYVSQIIEWNSLNSSNLYIGDKLVIYVKKRANTVVVKLGKNKYEYTIKKGDTLWGIAERYDGLSISKIKSLNNLDSDNLKPGIKIILPLSL